MSLCILALLALSTPATALPPRGEAPLGDEGLAGRYGFADFEIYKVSNGIFDLCTGDLNGDGLADLAVADNARSRVECFLRLPADAPDEAGEPFGAETSNPVQFDGRYRRRRVAVDRRILQLELVDLDGDGRHELSYATDAARLVVRGLEDEGRSIVLDELRGGCQLLRRIDVDGDGRDELVVAGDERALVVRLTAERLTTAPLTVVENGLAGLDLADLDGDGQRDLLLVYGDQDYPFRVRRGQPGGALGPRLDLELPPVRSACVADLDGDGRAEVASVARLSGRVEVARLARRTDGVLSLARHALRAAEDKKGARARGFAVGDLDGDGSDDVVVSEGDAAQVLVLRAAPGSRALEAQEFPSLVSVASPRIADVDGDGRRELIVVSGPERMLGLASLDEAGRLPFPRTRAVSGEPLALEAADLNADGYADLQVLVATGEGRRRSFSLEIHYGGAEGLVDGPVVHPLPSIRKPPEALRAADVDRDGATDVIVFVPGEDEVPTILVQREGGFVHDERGGEAPGLGALRGLRSHNVNVLDVDGDGLLELAVGTENFARALYFDVGDKGELTPVVLEQFNGPAADARISACTAADLDGDGTLEIVLRDERTRELLVHRRGEDGRLERPRRVDAGRLSFGGLVVADLDGDQRDDVLVLGDEELGALYGDSEGWTLHELHSHDESRERLAFDRIAAGDLDGDGALDIVVSEATESSILLLRPEGDALKRALGFRVFEEKNFGQGGSSREPRELLAAELTGDGKEDLAVLVHDKLIVYVQE